MHLTYGIPGLPNRQVMVMDMMDAFHGANICEFRIPDPGFFLPIG